MTATDQLVPTRLATRREVANYITAQFPKYLPDPDNPTEAEYVEARRLVAVDAARHIDPDAIGLLFANSIAAKVTKGFQRAAIDAVRSRQLSLFPEAIENGYLRQEDGSYVRLGAATPRHLRSFARAEKAAAQKDFEARIAAVDGANELANQIEAEGAANVDEYVEIEGDE